MASIIFVDKLIGTLVNLDHEDRKLTFIAMAIKNPSIGINGFFKSRCKNVSRCQRH
jgi:hypothetical protein